MNTHKKLRELNSKATPDTEGNDRSTECSICLMSIAPCQSLFVAPCSHVWHYKCIRPLLNDHKMYPQFMCPNCRAVTDLEADIEEVSPTWDDEQELDDEEPAAAETQQPQLDGLPVAPPTADAAELADTTPANEVSATMATMELGDTSIDAALHSSTQPIEVPGTASQHLRASTPGEAELDGREGPLTPRNDAGPFVFDGSAGRASGRKAVPEQPRP